jgi:hypothetical protein
LKTHDYSVVIMKGMIPDAIIKILGIVDQLRAVYPKKKFTLDGRLLGDLGECLVEDAYDVRLFEDLRKQHDGRTSDGRQVQIKATMQDSLTFPVDHTPDYYLGIQIHQDGTFTEVFKWSGFYCARGCQGSKAYQDQSSLCSNSCTEEAERNSEA